MGEGKTHKMDLTDTLQKHAERLLQYVHDGILIIDSNEIVTFASPSARQLLSIQENHSNSTETTIHSFLSASGVTEVDSLLTTIRDTMRTGSTHTDHCIIHKHSSNSFYYLEYCIAVQDGPSCGVVCYLRDVTPSQELKKMELLAEVARLSADNVSIKSYGVHLVRTIAERLEVDLVVLALNRRGELQPCSFFCEDFQEGLQPCAVETAEYWSPEATKYTTELRVHSQGWRWSELTPRHCSNVNEAVIPLCWMGEIIGTMHLVNCMGSHEKALWPTLHNGTFRLDLVHYGNEFFDTLGNYVSTALQNIQLHEEISQERALLRTLIEAIPDPILLFNREGKVLIFNSASAVISGRDVWDYIGDDQNPFLTCDIHGNPLPKEEWPLSGAVLTGKGCTNKEFMLDFGDIQRRISATVIPVTNADGDISAFVATAQDITERSERDQRKDEFLSVASHELRSPLTPLKGFLHMLRHQVENKTMPDRHLFDRAEAQVQRLQQLVDRLLDLGHIETGRVQLQCAPTNIATLMRKVLDPWVNSSTHNREFRMDIPPDPIIAEIDAGRIDQVLTNLLDNAVKYSGNDARITVRLEQDASHALITIEDNGEGMDEETLAQIFQRFYRGSSARQNGSKPGIGLGLYISREIIELHKGDIQIDSKKDAYTRVLLRLPLFKRAI